MSHLATELQWLRSPTAPVDCAATDGRTNEQKPDYLYRVSTRAGCCVPCLSPGGTRAKRKGKRARQGLPVAPHPLPYLYAPVLHQHPVGRRLSFYVSEISSATTGLRTAAAMQPNPPQHQALAPRHHKRHERHTAPSKKRTSFMCDLPKRGQSLPVKRRHETPRRLPPSTNIGSILPIVAPSLPWEPAWLCHPLLSVHV